MPTSKELKWDVSGERLLESGVSKVVLYPMANGAYEKGVAWNGVTAINEAPGGADVTDLYADNIKYASLRAAETFGFTIEAYMYPDEWAECDGSKAALSGVMIGQQTRKAFGLCYRTEIGSDANPGMDKGYKIHIVYNNTASPSGRGYATINNSPDAISFSWEANSTPVNVEVGKNVFKPTCLITVDSTIVDSTHMAALEAALYGHDDASDASNSTDPRLPDPAEVLSILGYVAPSESQGSNNP